MTDLKTFIDLCSGIGGGRLGLERNGLQCVGHSEINPSSEATYRLFFGTAEPNYGDLMRVDALSLPDFDLLIAGFPCQTFSIAGKRAGFDDDRGLVIYGIIRILRIKKPPCFLLENVKGLLNHDKGRTLTTILAQLDEAGYDVHHAILNSVHYGVPQQRERIYMVGFRKDLANPPFSFPQQIAETGTLADILIPSRAGRVPFDVEGATFKRYLSNKYNIGRYTIGDLVAEDWMVIDTRHSDLRIYRGATPTLRTGRHGILYSYNRQLWRLNGVEALRLQGFGEDQVRHYLARPVVSDNTLLSQAGNAMTATVIEAIARNMTTALRGSVCSMTKELSIWH